MKRLQTIVAVVIVGVSLATLAGCTASPVLNTDWSNRMIAVLGDPHGQGGAGGHLRTDSGAKNARGTVYLDNVPSGEYEVLAASDIACGATLRLPVTVASTGVALEATDPSTSAQWQAVIVTPVWEPAPTTYSH